MRLTWLPNVLRAAGLTVREYSGREHDGRTWSTRGSADWGPIRGITIHETRGSRSSTDAGELRVLVKGSSSAPPPIAQLYLSRSGEWWVVASGRCNHNLTGWAGPNKGYGNSRLLGIEAQHAGGEPWTDAQYRSYVRGVAALVRRLGIPVARVAGHFEHQPGAKTDPSFNMDQFRRDVGRALAGEDDDMALSGEGKQDVREAHALGAYDLWHVMANGKSYNGTEAKVAESVRSNMQRVLTPMMQAVVAPIERRLDELAATPPGSVVISDEQLERVLRRVIGSVDDAESQARG